MVNMIIWNLYHSYLNEDMFLLHVFTYIKKISSLFIKYLIVVVDLLAVQALYAEIVNEQIFMTMIYDS